MSTENEPELPQFPDLSKFPPPVSQWYYNIATGAVEAGKQSSWTRRMGPYPTREAAEDALAHARNRNEAWDLAEEEWQEWNE